MDKSNISFRCIECNQEIEQLKEAWNELHLNCSRPSVYNSFDFIYESIRAFNNEEITTAIITLTDDASNQLLAIFPMQQHSSFWHIIKMNTYEYTALEEVDKPGPVIRKGYMEICWSSFIQYLMHQVKNWDHLQLIEIAEDSAELDFLEKLSVDNNFYYEKIFQNQGPMLNLQGDWNDYWHQHKKMRKKIRKMDNDFAERIEFKIHQDDWEECLQLYIELEQKSWKKGKTGISKNQQYKAFYSQFFSKIAAEGNLYFGFLTIDGQLVSAEIAYTNNATVYFCHGCYDQAYSKYSPGMVSTSHFIKYFYGEKYKEGDFLCGFAGYLNDWSDEILNTYKINIYPRRLKVRIMFVVRALRRRFIKPVIKGVKVIHGKIRPK